MDLEFGEDIAIVALNSVQGEEKPFANLAIGESLGDEPQRMERLFDTFGLARLLTFDRAHDYAERAAIDSGPPWPEAQLSVIGSA